MLLNLLIFFSFSAHADLKTELHNAVTLPHRPITYKEANIYLFTKIDNHQGIICSVYSPSDCLLSETIPSPKIMNIEHTWPQSEGANGLAKSDLHHLFATTSSTNSIRSSLPFCNVEQIKWEADQSKRGNSSFGEHCFEPPPKHKGNVARALFYFSIRYNAPIDANQEFFLRQWHKEDPVDQDERERNQLIGHYQHNSNIFIERPESVDLVSDF